MARSTAATTPESTDYQFPAVVNTCSYAGCHEPTSGASPLCEAHMVLMLGQKFAEQTARVVRSRWPEQQQQQQQQQGATGAKPAEPNAKARGSATSRASAAAADARPPKNRLGGPKMTKSAPRASASGPDKSPSSLKKSSAGAVSQQKSPTSPSDRSAPQRPAHSPPQSPSQSGIRTLKRQKLQTNGYNHETYQKQPESPSYAAPALYANGDRTPAPADQDGRWRLGRQSPVSRGCRQSPASASAVGNGTPLRVKTNMNSVANGLPNGYDHKENSQTPSAAWISPAYSAYPASDKQPKTPESKKAIPKAIEDNIRHWFRQDDRTETKPGAFDKTRTAAPERSPAASRPSWGGVSDDANDLDSIDETRPRSLAAPGRKPSGASAAMASTTPQRASRGQGFTTEGVKSRGALFQEKLRLGDLGSEPQPSLESWIYSQEGAPPPPRGAQVSPVPPRARGDGRDTAFFAAINPLTHWTRERSAAWMEAKQREIKERGGRKAQMGRVAERMAEQRRKDGGTRAADDRLPERIRNDPDWMLAMAWFDQCDKAQWEADKEAARQLEIQQQLEREAGSRTARRPAGSRGS